MVEWYTELATTFDEVWRELARGVADRHAAARHPAVATVGRDGGGEVRTVVLRAADRAAGRVAFHTDLAATKVAEIRAAPRLALMVWDAHLRLQIRLRATAEVHTGAAVADVWAELSEAERANYGGAPTPGTPLAAPEDHEAGADPRRFAVVRCALDEIETLHLGPDRHRRARFTAAAGWRGTWQAP
jgi:pyridoxamine 5'-phosphate oxidase